MAATARAILEIVTDASGVQPGIDKTEKSMGTLGGIATKVGGLMAGAFAVTEIIGAATEIVNFAGEITDLSAKTGIGTTALQELKYAGSQVGVELETITRGVTDMQKRIAGGDESAVGAMKALGLNFDDLRNMKPEDQFKAIAAEVAKVEDPADRVKLAMDLMGKSGAEMLPLLTDEFIGLTEKANSLGIVMDEETVAAMDTLGDTVGDLMNVGTAFLGKVLTPFIPLLTKTAEAAMWLADVYGDYLGWAIDKIGEGLKWLSLQAISGLRSLLSMGQGITEMFPSLAGAIGLTDSLTGAMALLDSAEKALTVTKDEGTKATERASTSTKKLNLDYAGAKKETDAAAKAQASLNAELQKMADTMTGKALVAEVNKYAAALKLAESQGGLTAHQQDELGKKLASLVEQGAKLPAPLAAIENRFHQMNLKGIPLVSTLESVRTAMAAVNQVALTAPPVFKLPQMSLKDIELQGPNPLSESILAWQNSVSVGQATESTGKVVGEGIRSSLARTAESLPGVIVGALQGGGSVFDAVAASIGAGLGEGISKRIKVSLGDGILGSLAGGLAATGVTLLTGAIASLFKGNDTKKDREAAARAMGFSSISAMNTALNALGAEGQKLVHEGLNVIGKKDTAANDAWIASVKELFDKQKELATVATEEAATAQAASLAKITDPLKAQLKDIDAEYQKLSDSIAKEAPEEIMGVIEAQERAALADLAVQKGVIENELKAAETKIIDSATLVRDGIEHLFKDPIKVRFDWSNFPTMAGAAGVPAGGAFGGAMAEGGVGRVHRPTWFLAGEKPGGEDFAFSGAGKSFSGGGGGRMNTTPLVIQADGRELARVTIQHMGEQLELGGY